MSYHPFGAEEQMKIPYCPQYGLSGREIARHSSCSLSSNALRVNPASVSISQPLLRCGNGNANGLLRPFFPRGADFQAIDCTRLACVINQLDNKVRKRLAYRTPSEVFNRARRSAFET